MDDHPSDTGFDQIVTWIEDRLEGPLTLEVIARQAGLSPYHFSRLFSARTGRSVMLHVRSRRLNCAARRLATEPGLRLIDLAFDCGFESQEAFTRAFKRAFGASPGRFRRAYWQPLEGTAPTTDSSEATARVERLPGLARREAFSVAGLTRRFSEGTAASIPELWERVIELMPFAGQMGWETFGVVRNVDRDENAFSYSAAGGLRADAPTPKGLERIDLPSANYAVFRITMDGGPIQPQVKAAMQLIWGELVPASGLVMAGTPDFQASDGRSPPDQPGSRIHYFVPVRP